MRLSDGLRWYHRVGIALLGFFLLAYVFRVSFVGAIVSTAPQIALRVSPGDSRALSATAAATTMVAANQEKAVRQKAAERARAAIRGNPTDVAALRTLGMVAEMDGDRKSALRYFNEAERLSRRDLLTQLWMIEHYSRSDDVETTLKHYDRALTISAKSKGVLFPVLVAATSDPALQLPIRRLVSRKPVHWWNDYLELLVTTGPLEGAVAVSEGLLDPRKASERALLHLLMGRLTREARYDLAWRVYLKATRDPKGATALLRNGDFEDGEDLPPFAWMLRDETELNAVREQRPDGQGDVLKLSAANARSGYVARQLIRLEAGSYSIDAEVGDLPLRRIDRPTIAIECIAPNGATSSILDLAAMSASSAVIKLEGKFRVPAACTWQWISIRIGGEGPVPDTPPWVDNLRIRKIG